MTSIVHAGAGDWSLAAIAPPERERMLAMLEQGSVLHFSGLRPGVPAASWQPLLDPSLADRASKNISLDPATGVLRGVRGDAARRHAVTALLADFQQHAAQLVLALAPAYSGALRLAPASLRLLEVEGRPASWRKDDSRLHVDAFPSRPNRGERILRVFHNLHPHAARVWRVGEPFADAARRFRPRLPRYSALGAWGLRALGVTKSRRSEYDHLMLQLHDAMKSDAAWQAGSPQETVTFGPGSTWVCFSDQVAHGAMAGQFMLEQTLHLPVSAMRSPRNSPLRILESLYGRPLA